MALVCSPGVFGSDEPIWLEAQPPTAPSLTWRSCLCGCWGSRRFTPPSNHRSQVHVSRLLLPGAGAAAGPSSQGIGSSSPGSKRTGAKQTARLPQEQSHSRGHTSWRCPLPGPQACWQPRPMRFGHQAHSAAGSWPRKGLCLPPPQGTFPLDCVPWVSPWNTKVWMPPTCPQVVIFSSAPGDQLFSQEPAWALSVVSETKALAYTLLARLITFYLKLKFSNS